MAGKKSEGCWKRREKAECLAEYGLGSSIDAPQAVKFSLPEYETCHAAASPISASGRLVGSSATVVADFSPEKGWQALQMVLGGGDDKSNELEIIMDAIAEQGARMWPLLRRLKEVGRNDQRLAALAEQLEKKMGPGPESGPQLARREREVMERAAAGDSNAEIAEILNLQVVTVAKTLSRAYRKLGAKNRSEAVRKWLFIKD